MTIFPRKSPRLAGRVNRIESELATISGRIKVLTRDVEKWGDAAVQDAVRRSLSAPDVPASVSDQRSSFQTIALPPAEPSGLPPDEWGRRHEERAASSQAPDTLQRAVVREDEQFANYFMSGGLKKEVVEPLRRERHTQRRKALFLLLCFFMILFALLFFRVWR